MEEYKVVVGAVRVISRHEAVLLRVPAELVITSDGRTANLVLPLQLLEVESEPSLAWPLVMAVAGEELDRAEFRLSIQCKRSQLAALFPQALLSHSSR